MMHTAESNSAVLCTLRSLAPRDDAKCTPQSLTPQWDEHRGAFKKFKYLGEIKTEIENILPVYQGPRWVRKKREVKNLVKHSL